MNNRPTIHTVVIYGALFAICFGAPIRTKAAQATNPPYLAEFPTVQRVRAELKGSNSMDTAARQMGAFWQFGQVIKKLAGARYYRGATPDENRLIGQYGMAYGAIQQYYASYPDRPKWYQMHAFYETDDAFLDQLLQQFFSPEFRAGYYRTIGKQLPQPQRIQPIWPERSSTGQPSVSTGLSPAEVNRDLGHKEFEAGQKFDGSRNEAAAAQSFRRALEYYKAAIALDPNVTGVYYRVGACYYKAKAYQLALSAWKKFRAQEPENIGVLSDMSRAHEALKQYDQALTLVQEGIRRKPNKIDSLLLYGDLCSVHYGLREYEKALAACHEVTRIDPFFTNHLMMGHAYYQLRRYPEAAESYTRATNRFNKNVEAIYGLGLTYIRMGRKDEALRAYQELLGIDPKRAQQLYAAINNGPPSQPTSTSASGLSTSSSAPSGTDSTPATLNASAADSAKAYSDLGFQHYKAKEYAKAIDAYKKAISLNPNLLVAHLFLGNIYHHQERWDLAAATLKRALALKPDNNLLGGLLVHLAAAQRELKQYDEALESYRHQIRVMPTAGAYYWTGWIYSEIGQYEKAVPAFREALRLKPDDAYSAYFLGHAYYNLKQYPSVVAAFQQAIRLKPDYAEAHRYLGVTYLTMGQKDQALHTYQTLLTLDKQKAQELLAEINKTR